MTLTWLIVKAYFRDLVRHYLLYALIAGTLALLIGHGDKKLSNTLGWWFVLVMPWVFGFMVAWYRYWRPHRGLRPPLPPYSRGRSPSVSRVPLPKPQARGRLPFA